MRALVVTFVGSMALSAISVQAAPNLTKATPVELGAKPSVELVAQGCGWGWHRVNWRDRGGYWHWGRCVPNWR